LAPISALPLPDKKETHSRGKKYEDHVGNQPMVDIIRAAERFLTRTGPIVLPLSSSSTAGQGILRWQAVMAVRFLPCQGAREGRSQLRWMADCADNLADAGPVVTAVVRCNLVGRSPMWPSRPIWKARPGALHSAEMLCGYAGQGAPWTMCC